MCEKDYNLLRPFDLEEAKRGGAVTCNTLGTVLHYVAGPDVHGFVCAKHEFGQFVIYKMENLRMAPFCWVEGKPVYKGDVLYNKKTEIPYKYIANYVDSFGNLSSNGTTDGTLEHPKNLSWTPPKVKREGWINIYKPTYTKGLLAIAFVSDAYSTRKDADDYAENNRIACVHIEWEE